GRPRTRCRTSTEAAARSGSRSSPGSSRSSAGECTFRDSPYPSGHMAEFQWWLLLVGLVAGGGLVFVVSMDGRRRGQDIGELEQSAKATWIACQLSGRGAETPTGPDAATVEDVLRAHREYLSLQPPDRLVVEPGDHLDPLDRGSGLDRDPDREPHNVGDHGRGTPDQNLAPAAEQRTATGQEAHAGADG